MSTENTKSIPERFRLVAVRTGSSITQSVASAVLASKVLSSAAAAEFQTAAGAMGGAQMQLAHKALLAVRVQMRNGDKMTELSKVVAEFAAKNPGALGELERMSLGGVASLTVKSSIVGTLVAATLQEAMAVATFVTAGDKGALVETTKETVGGSIGALVLGTGGAVIGTLVFPGAGTIIGSLIGSLTGSTIGASAVRGKQVASQQDGFGSPSEPATVVRDDVVIVYLPESLPCDFPEDSASVAKFVGEDPVSPAEDDIILFFAPENSD